MSLQNYVKAEFFELPQKHWSEKMVQDFIIKAIELDTDVYEAIINISHKDLYQHMAENDPASVTKELNEIQSAMFANAVYQIGEIIIDIENDLECEDSSRDEESENISLDNQRTMH